MARQEAFAQLVAAGKATFEGDRKPFEQLMAAMTIFTPNFELLPGTIAQQAADNWAVVLVAVVARPTKSP